MKINKHNFMITVLSCFALLIVILYFIGNYCVHYDNTKPNIFQIPNTTSEYITGERIIYTEYYFIQRLPKSEEELEKIVMEYIKTNNIASNVKTKRSYISINFMIPDWSLPIWFEENASYFKMDDFIAHYEKTNRIALYTYNSDENHEDLYIYYE